MRAMLVNPKNWGYEGPAKDVPIDEPFLVIITSLAPVITKGAAFVKDFDSYEAAIACIDQTLADLKAERDRTL